MLKFSIASYQRVTALFITDVITASIKMFKRREDVFADVNEMSE